MTVREMFESKRFQALLVVSFVLVGAAAATAAATRPPCTREVIDGVVESSGDFRAVSVVLYQAGMFPGDPVIVRVEGNITTTDWFTVDLPGVRVLDQLRVHGQGARVNAFFLEDGALKFYAELQDGAPSAKIIIYYIPGSASWSHRYELDLDADQIALIANVNWRSSVIFRDIDFLLVSGKLHSVPQRGNNSYAPEAPVASSAGGFSFDRSPFGLASSVSNPERDELGAFTIPVSSDAGIYVVHRSEGVDLPGSAGKAVNACGTFTFYIRVYESPLVKEELVVARSTGVPYGAPFAGASTEPQGFPLFIELTNTGDLPWIPGRAELWRDEILVGSDNLPYTQRSGQARVQMGVAFDLTVSRTVESLDNETFVNFSAKNTDTVDYLLEIREPVSGRDITDLGPFVREGDELVARVPLAPSEEAAARFRARA
jgi:hypothetical protein